MDELVDDHIRVVCWTTTPSSINVTADPPSSTTTPLPTGQPPSRLSLIPLIQAQSVFRCLIARRLEICRAVRASYPRLSPSFIPPLSSFDSRLIRLDNIKQLHHPNLLPWHGRRSFRLARCPLHSTHHYCTHRHPITRVTRHSVSTRRRQLRFRSSTSIPRVTVESLPSPPVSRP
jgi:hypothetical protein